MTKNESDLANTVVLKHWINPWGAVERLKGRYRADLGPGEPRAFGLNRFDAIRNLAEIASPDHKFALERAA